jgi:hypothetical protein
MARKKRKPSWSSNGDDEEQGDSIFAHNPFLEGLLEWMGSPEGQRYIEISDDLWDLLDDVVLDAAQRVLIWPDAQRLDIARSIQHILKLCPRYSREEVEEFLLFWLEEGYDPENVYEQFDELDRLTAQWVKDYKRQPKISKSWWKTRHS